MQIINKNKINIKMAKSTVYLLKTQKNFYILVVVVIKI